MYMGYKIKFFSCIIIFILSSCKPGPGGSDMLADAVVNSITSPVITNMTSDIIDGVGKVTDDIKDLELGKIFNGKKNISNNIKDRFKNMPDSTICNKATVTIAGVKSWYSGNNSVYVSEAKRRDLKCLSKP